MYNLKYRQTTKRLGHSSVSIQELIDWCNEYSSLPEDLDEVFCGEFKFKFNSQNDIIYFRIFVTTKRLISLINFNPFLLATDATHKTNWNGFMCCISYAPNPNDEISRDRVEKHFEFIERDLDQNDFYDMTIIFSCNYVDVENENWKPSKCNCSWWQKNYMCRHFIVVSVILGLIEYPPESRNVHL